MVICLERGADLHVARLMPLPLTVFCFSKIQIGLTFLVPAHPGRPGKRAVKWVCVCVCVCQQNIETMLETSVRFVSVSDFLILFFILELTCLCCLSAG